MAAKDKEVATAKVIQLDVREARTFFIGPEKKLRVMFKALRVRDKNSYWKSRYLLKKFAYLGEEKREQIERQAKYIRFYNRRDDSFSTGLLPRVEARLLKKGVAYRITDQRKKVPTRGKIFKKINFMDEVEARPEQIRLIKTALRCGKGIIHAATNFGKTEVACAIISAYREQTGKVPRCLFLIHRAGLAAQTVKRFQQHLGDPKTMQGVEIGGEEIVFPVNLLGAGSKDIPKGGILVATTQTCSNMLSYKDPDLMKFLGRCDILFIDEFHVNKAWQLSRIVDKCEAPMRFGLSGTIDKKNLTKMLHYEGMTGPIIAEVRNKELVGLGRSAKPFIRFREVRSDKLVVASFGEAYREGIVNNQFRNRLICKDITSYVEKDYRTLVTVGRIKHGLKLKERLERRMDVPVEFIRGNTPVPIREKIVSKFEAGEIAVLIASPIFDVGMDVPAIEAWVNAAGGKGWELVLQRLGRVLRKKKGKKNRVFISDYVDLFNKYLMKHSLARIKHYVNEEIAEITYV